MGEVVEALRSQPTVAASSLAVVSAGFSITGMTAVFVGATCRSSAWASRSSSARLSAAAWLGGYGGARALRAALIVLVAVLIWLNAIGAHGFLAKAHIGHAVDGETAVAARSAEVDARQFVQAGVVADLDRRLSQIDSVVAPATQRGR